MTLKDRLKKKLDDVTGAAKNELAAHQQKAESDVAADSHVAGARDGDGDEDGTYVGRTSPQFDADVEQSGAEARSEQQRRSQ